MKTVLKVDIRHQNGDFRLDVQFTAHARVTALSGHSGAGKTTVLTIMSGLIRPDFAQISVDGVMLVDTKTGVFIPPHRRRIGCVFQEARLFPHLNVRQNLLYGRFFNPAPDKALQHKMYHAVLELLGITPLLSRQPHTLSGGEKQRVAIGRALLANPRLLVMDEPLASLDAARKAEIFPYLERLRDESEIPILYVSHIREEITRFASEVILMENGQVVRFGDVATVMDHVKS